MNSFLFKTAISAVVVVGVSELGKRWSVAAAILAALPLTSILAMIWLYRDTHDSEKIVSLSYGIFWAVLPSLLFFLILPFLLKIGMKFPLALTLSSAGMVVSYLMYIWILKRFGISF